MDRIIRIGRFSISFRTMENGFLKMYSINLGIFDLRLKADYFKRL